MAYDLEWLKLGGKIMQIAEKEFSASFSDDTDSALVSRLCQEYVDEGKPKGKEAWIRKRLEKLFLYVSKPPKWVEKGVVPRWPFLNGKPMVFICQYALVDSPLVKERLASGLVFYLFADRQPAGERSFEISYRVVEQIHDAKNEPPIPYDQLRDLFECLDRKSMTGYQCDHTYAISESFLRERGLPVQPMLKWLGGNGAGCDCEVMLNTAQQWEGLVGYQPPEEDGGKKSSAGQ
jgi:hypothetical protein